MDDAGHRWMQVIKWHHSDHAYAAVCILLPRFQRVGPAQARSVRSTIAPSSYRYAHPPNAIPLLNGQVRTLPPSPQRYSPTAHFLLPLALSPQRSPPCKSLLLLAAAVSTLSAAAAATLPAHVGFLSPTASLAGYVIFPSSLPPSLISPTDRSFFIDPHIRL